MRERDLERNTPMAEGEARRLFGDSFFGADEVGSVFGPERGSNIEPIPFSQQELQEAAEKGASLIYRIDTMPNGEPVTMENLHTFAPNMLSGDETAAAKEYDMEFYTQEEVTSGWTLTREVQVPHTNHLSFEACAALMNKDEGALEEALVATQQAWEDAKFPVEDRPQLPTMDELKIVMEGLVDTADLPAAVDILYDALMNKQVHGKDILEDTSVVTRGKNQALPAIGEPERPIDMGRDADGALKLHWRRSMQWGRPGQLGEGSTPGLPIGYLQRQKK